jgi:hypothetical protein
MRGFGDFDSAARFCRAFEEIRQYFRYRSKTNEKVSLGDQCSHLLEKWLNYSPSSTLPDLHLFLQDHFSLKADCSLSLDTTVC